MRQQQFLVTILGSLLISRYVTAKYLLVEIGDGVEEGIGGRILKDDSQGIFCLLMNKLAINGNKNSKYRQNKTIFPFI